MVEVTNPSTCSCDLSSKAALYNREIPKEYWTLDRYLKSKSLIRYSGKEYLKKQYHIHEIFNHTLVGERGIESFFSSSNAGSPIRQLEGSRLQKKARAD